MLQGPATASCEWAMVKSTGFGPETMKEEPRASPAPASFASDDEPGWPEAVHYYAFRLRQQGRAWRPPTDVYETDAEFAVLVELAGMRGVEISVTLEEQLLRIRGQRPVGGGEGQQAGAHGQDSEGEGDAPQPAEAGSGRGGRTHRAGSL